MSRSFQAELKRKTIGAEQAAALCRELQQFAQAADFAEASSRFVRLKEAIAELEANLRVYARQNTAAPEAQSQSKTKRRPPGSKPKRP